MRFCNAVQIGTTTFIDPNSKQEIELGVYILDGGGMVAVDASYIEQEAVAGELTDEEWATHEGALFFSPFQRDRLVVEHE